MNSLRKKSINELEQPYVSKLMREKLSSVGSARIIRFVGVPVMKLSQLIKDIADELDGRDVKITITRDIVELTLYENT